MLDGIDIGTLTGIDIFNIFASLAEYEREIIREPSQAGLKAAKSIRRNGGRPKGLSLKARNKADYAKKPFAAGNKSDPP